MLPPRATSWQLTAPTPPDDAPRRQGRGHFFKTPPGRRAGGGADRRRFVRWLWRPVLLS